MGEKTATILVVVGVLGIFIAVIAGTVQPAIQDKGNEIVTEIQGP